MRWTHFRVWNLINLQFWSCGLDLESQSFIGSVGQNELLSGWLSEWTYSQGVSTKNLYGNGYVIAIELV